MYLAVDIGGTKTLIAVFTPEGEIVESQKFPTSQDYDQFKIDLADNVAKLSTKEFFKGIIGSRGTMDRAEGILISGGIALAWRNVPLVKDLSDLIRCSVLIENDSKLSGLSEAILVKDTYRKAFYFTISSGIGGAFMIDGKLDLNTIDLEVGNTIYMYEGTYQPWESFAAGRSVVAKYGKQVSEIEDPKILEAISENLALGFINIATLFTPDVFIVGGGAGGHLENFRQPLEAKLREMQEVITGIVNIPPIIKAQRPEEAVVYGCYELAKQHYDSQSAK